MRLITQADFEAMERQYPYLRGRWVYYSLSKEAFDDASGFIKSLKGHRRLAVLGDDCCK